MDSVRKNGGKSFISKVGHAFITEDVNREGAYFAGESSGHFYFRETGWSRKRCQSNYLYTQSIKYYWKNSLRASFSAR